MTVENNVARNQYSASGGQTVFAYTFEIFDKGDLAVVQNITTLTEGVDYTVSGVGNDSGGSITLTIGATGGDIITIYMDMQLQRLNDYQNSGDFLADEVNDDFDRIWLALQQGGPGSSLALRGAQEDPVFNSSNTILAAPSIRASTALGFSSTGELEYLSSAAVPSSGDFTSFTTVAAMVLDSGLTIGDWVSVEDYATGNNSGYLFFKIVAAATGTADGGSFIDLSGSGLQAKQNFPGLITVLMFGATGDGVTDDSVAIQAATDFAATLGKVYFPKPNVEYIFATTIAIPGGQTWQGEIDHTATRTPTEGASLLRYTGTGLAITCLEMQWINVVLQGNVSTSFAPNIGTGITNTGVLRLEGSTVRGFAKGIDSVGGFYHVFERCNFFHNNTCLDFLIVNNVNFHMCRFTKFDIGVSGSGGVGFANFSQCSMEQWTGQLVQHLAGSKFAVSFSQGYIENYPEIAIDTGITDTGGTGNYDLANGFTQGRTFSLTDNLISNKGIKRLINGNADGVLWQKGNMLVMYAAGAAVPNEMERIVSLLGQPTMQVMEDSYEFIDSAGAEQATAALAGITTVQISVTVSEGREFRYLDYDGNIISSGTRRSFVTDSITLDIQDYGKLIIMNKATATVVTVPGLPEGWFCYVEQEGLGGVSFIAGTGMDFLRSGGGGSFTIKGRDGIVKVYATATNKATLTGDLVEIINQDPQTGTTFTPDIDNTNELMELTNAASIACTIPPNADVPYLVGITLFFKQGGAGQITYGPGAGVTLNSELGLKSTGQESWQAFYQESIDVWSATGRLEA